jgi:hypothetical protein
VIRDSDDRRTLDLFPGTPRDPEAIPLPTTPGGFGLILADPPWRWTPWSWATGSSRAAENHYGTDPLDVIKALPMPAIAARNCALVLWAISSMLPQALEVMDCWKFTYKTGAVWVKESIGKGYWWRQRHELLLLGIKGKVPAPPPGSASRPSSMPRVAGIPKSRKRSPACWKSCFPINRGSSSTPESSGLTGLSGGMKPPGSPAFPPPHRLRGFPRGVNNYA